MKRFCTAALAGSLLVSSASLALAQAPAPTPAQPSGASADAPSASGSNLPSAAPLIVGGAGLSFDPSPQTSNAGHFTAGAGIYYLQPYFQTNPAYRIGTALGAQQEDFRYGMHVEPLIWLGYTTDGGWGGRVRWWEFNAGSVAGPFPQGTTGVITSAPVYGFTTNLAGTSRFASNLHLNVWDAEATSKLALGSWDGLLSGGVRYAHLAQDYTAGAVFTVPGNIYPESFVFSHNFNGAGPTIALEGHRPLGCWGLSLYGNVRGSILFGSAHQRFFGQGAALVASNETLQYQADAASVLPVGELEVGAEWDYALGRYHFFAQTALVGQVWIGAGNASNTNGVFTGTTAVGTGTSSSLGLVGLSVRAGFDF